MSFKRTAALLSLLWAASGTAYANWTATGTFQYVDREFDQNGFTGVQPSLPIRFATVEVRDFNASGSKALLATGSTDGSGNFSITVTDTKTRTVYVRVLSTSTAVPTLFLRVENVSTPKNPYALASSTVANHPPSTNLNFGTTTGAIGSGGDAFNIYDVALRSVDYIAALNGSRPGSSNPLALEWEPFSGNVVSDYDYTNKRIHVGDPSSYNDTVIQHESGHYAFQLYSATDNPGGVHHLTDCGQDLRLAFEEGRATWFGQSVRRYFGLSRPDLYVKTTGAPGPGNLDFYFDVESETPYYCDGAASEVAVQSALWDINDAAATADGSPGVDDDGLARPDTDAWDVHKNYIPTAANKSLEDFWDGWFARGKGFKSSMQASFDLTNAEFFQDSSEPNDTVATAMPNPALGTPVHLTYFADSNGDGIGEADHDYFSFNATAGTAYTIETLNLWGDANTSLELLASNGTTVLASNDDRTSFIDYSSLINYTPTSSGVLYVHSFHASDLGIYGSYDLKITGNSPVDADGDGYFSNVDCNDNNASIHPGATEICDGIDEDCDGIRDNGFADADADGYASCGGDCNDNAAGVNPGATEICNGIDDNCAGGVDEGFDADADGYTTCGGDCNDANPAVHPGAIEVCNGIDDNCVGGVDEGFDADADGYTTCGGDCNDNNAAIHPNATENCSNGVDDNCNNLTDSQDPACQSDTVVITKAEYRASNKKLTVWATSTRAPSAVLTLVGYGTMTYDSANNRYTFTKSNATNPGSVTVNSSLGGTDTEPVTPI